MSVAQAFYGKTGMKLGKSIYPLGDELGVFNIVSHPSKLVKICQTYDEHSRKTLRLLKKLKEINSPAVVKIHQFGLLPSYPDHYFYVMDKLLSLRYPYSDCDQICDHLLDDLPFTSRTSKRIRKFVNNANKLRELNMHYGDLHEMNIKRDRKGDIRFIDLESFLF
jgi:hypothetical protein